MQLPNRHLHIGERRSKGQGQVAPASADVDYLTWAALHCRLAAAQQFPDKLQHHRDLGSLLPRREVCQPRRRGAEVQHRIRGAERTTISAAAATAAAAARRRRGLLEGRATAQLGPLLLQQPRPRRVALQQLPLLPGQARGAWAAALLAAEGEPTTPPRAEGPPLRRRHRQRGLEVGQGDAEPRGYIMRPQNAPLDALQDLFQEQRGRPLPQAPELRGGGVQRNLPRPADAGVPRDHVDGARFHKLHPDHLTSEDDLQEYGFLTEAPKAVAFSEGRLGVRCTDVDKPSVLVPAAPENEARPPQRHLGPHLALGQPPASKRGRGSEVAVVEGRRGAFLFPSTQGPPPQAGIPASPVRIGLPSSPPRSQPDRHASTDQARACGGFQASAARRVGAQGGAAGQPVPGA
mmetsp:Transcript_170398/g.541284  ORF Transcript_170398/g.541284 Transcript_170398/m.541284 type:complete len:405 (+) Transcript_170398:504-1718(+)